MRLFAFYFILSLNLSAAQFNWIYSYKEASAKAQTENKPMVVYMHRPGWESCDFLEQKVFNDENLSSYVNTHYIPTLLNVSKSDVPKHLVVKASPVFHFVDGKGEKIQDTQYGGKNAKAFLKILQDVEGKYKRKQKPTK